VFCCIIDDGNRGFLRSDELVVDEKTFTLDYLWENFQVGANMLAKHPLGYM
jgi:hypothetical protein